MTAILKKQNAYESMIDYSIHSTNNQYDMSQFEDDSDNDVNEYDLFDYKYLDYYWTEGGWS